MGHSEVKLNTHCEALLTALPCKNVLNTKVNPEGTLQGEQDTQHTHSALSVSVSADISYIFSVSSTKYLHHLV